MLVVRRSGDIYLAVNPDREGTDPGRLLALRDRDGDGRVDVVTTIADVGGNGVALDPLELGLYFARNDRVLNLRAHVSGALGAAGGAVLYGAAVSRGLPRRRLRLGESRNAMGSGCDSHSAVPDGRGSPCRPCARSGRFTPRNHTWS